MHRELAVLTLFALLARAHPPPQGLVSWGERQSPEEETPTRQCSCQGPQCQCCVDFNISFVDLGGPGCVQMKYVDAEEGMMVNVTYGDNQLHSEQIKGTEPVLTCMNLLSDLAQICARFSQMSMTSEGPKGCVALEPTLLGDAQDAYNMGCFEMGPKGMSFHPPVNTTAPPPSTAEPSGETEVSEEALIAAVNESAEEGIAWFSSLLGLSFGSAKNETVTASTETSTPAQAQT